MFLTPLFTAKHPQVFITINILFWRTSSKKCLKQTIGNRILQNSSKKTLTLKNMKNPSSNKGIRTT